MLVLFGTSLQCDERLQWMKIGEEQGWLTVEWDLPGFTFVPHCRNYPHNVIWSEIDLPGNESCNANILFLLV